MLAFSTEVGIFSILTELLRFFRLAALPLGSASSHWSPHHPLSFCISIPPVIAPGLYLHSGIGHQSFWYWCQSTSRSFSALHPVSEESTPGKPGTSTVWYPGVSVADTPLILDAALHLGRRSRWTTACCTPPGSFSPPSRAHWWQGTSACQNLPHGLSGSVLSPAMTYGRFWWRPGSVYHPAASSWNHLDAGWRQTRVSAGTVPWSWSSG